MKSLRLFPVLAAVALLSIGVGGCEKNGPKDVGNEHKRSEFTGAGNGTTLSGHANANDAKDAGGLHIATPIVSGKKPREISHANARAIVTSKSHIYFGDAEDDALFSLPKNSNDATRISRRAPMPSSLSFDDATNTLVWIANPGDTVFRIVTAHPSANAAPSTVRDRGLFTDVAIASGGDVFITEAQNASGVLTRITGNTAARIATIDGLPRGIAVDADHVYVATTTRLAKTSRTLGAVVDLAKGSSFSHPHVVEGGDVIATTTPEGQATTHKRIIVRARKKTGLSGTDQIGVDTIASNVRDAPIAVHKGIAYWFDADRPALLSQSITASSSSPQTIVSEDPIFEHPNAIAVDDDGIYIATGYGESARVVVVN
jgi:hypothetical protein